MGHGQRAVLASILWSQKPRCTQVSSGLSLPGVWLIQPHSPLAWTPARAPGWWLGLHAAVLGAGTSAGW